MAVSVKVTCHFEVATSRGILRVGSTTPLSITCDGTVHDQTVSITSNATPATSLTTLFNDTEDIADFDFLYIISSQNIMLELTTDLNNGVGDEVYTLPLLANMPFILGRDDSYANYSAGFAGGTLDTIERIRASNTSGSTAEVRIVAIT